MPFNMRLEIEGKEYLFQNLECSLWSLVQTRKGPAIEEGSGRFVFGVPTSQGDA